MPLHFMPNWSNYMKGASPYLRYWVLLDPAVHLINSSFFISVVDLKRLSNILPFGCVFHCFKKKKFFPGVRIALNYCPAHPPCCLSCNQWPLLLNYGVWIWALWWPSPSDPTTDPSIREHPSCHCFVPCIAISPCSFFFLFSFVGSLWRGKWKEAGHSCCVLTSPHFRGSEQGLGVYFDSW